MTDVWRSQGPHGNSTANAAGPRSRRGGNDMKHHRWAMFAARTLIVLIALVAASADAADPREAGPRALIITYHTTPANRIAFRRELDSSVAQQWRRWRDE